MKRLSLGKILIALFALALGAGVVYGFLPRPLLVDAGRVSRAPMLVAVTEDGKTRIREKYVVSMPFQGRISRIGLDPGDPVSAGESVIATIYAVEPELLSPRALAEAEARVRAAEAAVKQADEARERAATEKEWAQETLQRVTRLFEQKATSEEKFIDAGLLFRTRESSLESAEFARQIARFELEQAQAALLRAQPASSVSAADWQYNVLAPVGGVVLRRLQESAVVLPQGAPLVELGDPKDLEMEIDVLSQDAVRIRPGANVYVEHWGGDAPLKGAVRVVEPAGFTKISALGVEEQRVNVIVDFRVPEADRARLGDGYRIEARIAVWEGDAVLQTPGSALFRIGEDWCVFVVSPQGRAVRRRVEIGHRNAQSAEVLSGLDEGEQVVLHPGDALNDGGLITIRTP